MAGRQERERRLVEATFRKTRRVPVISRRGSTEARGLRERNRGYEMLLRKGHESKGSDEKNLVVA